MAKKQYTQILKGNHCILRIGGAPVCQKVPKLFFQSQFSMSKINGTYVPLRSHFQISQMVWISTSHQKYNEGQLWLY